jgi:hypothetical protein
MGEAREVLWRLNPPQDYEVIEILQSGDRERFAEWIATDPDLEQRWELERTPLLWATYFDRGEIVSTLLARGARLDVSDYRGNTAMHFAAMNGNLKLARSFIEVGADLDPVNDYGETPLAQSLFAPDTQMMEFLLFLGSDSCMGPHGRSDVLDLVRTTMTGHEPAASKLLEPAVEKRACRTTSKQARRDNTREFTAKLQELTPPPNWVLDRGPSISAINNSDDLGEAARKLYGRMRYAETLEEWEETVADRRAMGYRAVLDHPDREAFAWSGAGLWAPARTQEDIETVVRIDRLRLQYFPYFQTDVECLLCDPDEHEKGNRSALTVSFQADHLVRLGRYLEAIDVCEKFTRERFHEAMPSHRGAVIRSLIPALWYAGRKAEAYALGEAELTRNYGSDSKKASQSRVGILLKGMRLADEATRDPNLTTQASSSEPRAATPES